MVDRDYVLGTHDAEIERLGLQHLVWRRWMLSAWQRAGITRGSRVIDVGAGPGFATADLAEIVGERGEVLGLERSSRFAAAARQRRAVRGNPRARIEEVDLMVDGIAARSYDALWCRWVASFVSSPAQLINDTAGALRPGGVAVFHEYGDYAAWRLMPRRSTMEAFVAAVMASWRASGGEPDVGLLLPGLFTQVGLRIREVRPLVFIARPTDFVWQWPAAFLKSGVDRLRELGRLDDHEAKDIVEDFDDAEADPSTLMMTPLVLEIIAERAPA